MQSVDVIGIGAKPKSLPHKQLASNITNLLLWGSSIVMALLFWLWILFSSRLVKTGCFQPVVKRKASPLPTYVHALCRNRKKPPWVTDKVLYLKAVTGFGCGKVAETFNRLHGDRETVSKSFVYDKIINNRYKLLVIKRDIRNKPPRVVPVNQTWGMDLTTVNFNGKQKTVLGIVDHGSRLCLKLTVLEATNSWQIVKSIADTIRQYGFPKHIRTDNGPSFVSRTTRLLLRLLGVRHQRTNIASPWQNGRIERFFGTFKPLFKTACFEETADLQAQLDIYAAWYNCVRTHENIGGLTPKEAWVGKRDNKRKAPFLVSGWHGILTGYYFPT